MFGKMAFLALVLAAGVAAPCFAQDAGVSGIRGVGSAGGLNNSVNDPAAPATRRGHQRRRRRTSLSRRCHPRPP